MYLNLRLASHWDLCFMYPFLLCVFFTPPRCLVLRKNIVDAIWDALFEISQDDSILQVAVATEEDCFVSILVLGGRRVNMTFMEREENCDDTWHEKQMGFMHATTHVFSHMTDVDFPQFPDYTFQSHNHLQAHALRDNQTSFVTRLLSKEVSFDEFFQSGRPFVIRKLQMEQD